MSLRSQAFWSIQAEEEEKQRQEIEASLERRKLLKEKEERIKVEKNKENRFFQNLLERARKVHHGIDPDQPHEPQESHTAHTEAAPKRTKSARTELSAKTELSARKNPVGKIVSASVSLEGLQLDSAKDRQRFPRLFKTVIADKLSVDRSCVRITKVDETLTGVSVGFEVKHRVTKGQINLNTVSDITAYANNGGLQSALASRGMTATSTHTEDAFAFNTVQRTQSTASWKPEENISEDDEEVATLPITPPKPTKLAAMKEMPKSPADNSQALQSADKKQASPKRAAQQPKPSRPLEKIPSQKVERKARAPANATKETSTEIPKEASKEAPVSFISEEADASKTSMSPQSKLFPKIAQAAAEKVGGKRQMLHMDAFKELVQSKFKSVFEAFVFFDSMKMNFVSTKNLKRGLEKLEAHDLLNDFHALIRDFEWKCVDHGKIHCGEFVRLLHWHHVDDFHKEIRCDSVLSPCTYVFISLHVCLF